MLHIILAILKIVGILLGIIVLLVLLAIGSVLFVPLRYRVNAAKDADGIRVCGKISWLLHLAAVTAEYRNGKPVLGVRILFIKKNLIPGEDAPPEKQRKQRKPRGKPKEKEKAGRKEEAFPEASGEIQKREEKKPVEEMQQCKSESSEQEAPVQEEKKASWWKRVMDKLNAVRHKIRNFLEGMKQLPGKVWKLWERVKASCQKVSDLVAFLFSDLVKSVFRRFRQHILYLWRHLKPDRIRGDVRYGFDDPSLTGQLTGLLYLLLPASCYEIRLEPDFENMVCEGNLHISGHIRLCHLARIAWKVFRDKEFRKILKKFQS